jgi:glutaryl-CoA dehydrogenase
MPTIRYKSPDYYLVDELLTDEHKLIRGSVRDWVNRAVMPVIDEANQKHEFPRHLVKELGEIGAFGPYIPVEYGGSGLDQVSYGLIMQELERGDSSIRSMASVQSSLVMYPIYKYGTEEPPKMSYR